jgi:hypothetical protein
MSTGTAAATGFLVGFVPLMLYGCVTYSNPECDDLCGFNLIPIFFVSLFAGLVGALIAVAIKNRL